MVVVFKLLCPSIDCNCNKFPLKHRCSRRQKEIENHGKHKENDDRLQPADNKFERYLRQANHCTQTNCRKQITPKVIHKKKKNNI